MGCWNEKYLKHGSRPGRFPQRSWRSFAPLLLSAVEANRRLLYLKLLLKALYVPGYRRLEPAPSLLLKGAGLLCFRLLSTVTVRLLPPRAALFGFACRQRHIHVILLLTRAEWDAQRGGLLSRPLAWIAGSIQHSRLQEDAKLSEAAAP